MSNVSFIATVRDESVLNLVGNLDVGAGDALLEAYGAAAANAGTIHTR